MTYKNRVNSCRAARLVWLAPQCPSSSERVLRSQTVEAFKHTLLSAKSIVYADPANGGLSGVYFAHVLDRLGLTEQLRAKTILVPGAQAAEVVAKGDAELGVAQGSEI